MRRNNLVLSAFLSVVIFAAQGLVASPCTDFSTGLFNGTFHVTHTLTSKKSALSALTFLSIPTSASKKLGLRKDESMATYGNYAVSDYQFALNADPKTIDIAKRFDRASVVSFSKSPDLCFLLWASSVDSELVDVNTILGLDGAGNIRLGSNNKADGTEHMLFSRQ